MSETELERNRVSKTVHRFELRNVDLQFGTRSLFQNLNVNFLGPQIFAILGPSGCGKSTLIRLLAGLQNPTSGVIQKPDATFGFIFQESHLLNWRNTFENVHLPLEIQGLSNPKLVEESLSAVGLSGTEKLYPKELSGGMKMRASIARAFVTNPKVLFCDEPFAALDEVTRENLTLLLRKKVLDNQATCFFVTHNLSEALHLADQIYFFSKPGVLETTPIPVDREKNLESQLQQLRQTVRGSFK